MAGVPERDLGSIFTLVPSCGSSVLSRRFRTRRPIRGLVNGVLLDDAMDVAEVPIPSVTTNEKLQNDCCGSGLTCGASTRSVAAIGIAIGATPFSLLLAHPLSHQVLDIPVLIPFVVLVNHPLARCIGAGLHLDLVVMAQMAFARYMGE